MNDFGSIRDAVSRVAPRYAIAKAAVFSLYASDQVHTGGDACLLLDVGCTFSRADAAQFRRFIAEDLGCTVDVVLRSALTAEDFARAETEARVVYENPDVTIASTPDTRAQATPRPRPSRPSASAHLRGVSAVFAEEGCTSCAFAIMEPYPHENRCARAHDIDMKELLHVRNLRIHPSDQR